MNEIVRIKDKILEARPELMRHFFIANTDKSEYQIEKFVEGSQDDIGRQYCQVVIEIRACQNEIRRLYYDAECAAVIVRRSELAIERKLKKIKFLKFFGRNTEDLELDVRKARADLHQFQVKMDDIALSIDAREKEFDKFNRRLKKFPEMSVEKLEALEKTFYWKRLERMTIEDRLSRTTGIGIGNIRALLQANMVTVRQELDLYGNENLRMLWNNEESGLPCREIKALPHFSGV